MLSRNDRAASITIEARDVAKAYGPVTVLRGVTLTLLPGQTHTLMGENGAGKSTLFKIMSGIAQPTSGSLLLDGEAHAIADPHEAHERGIFLVPQEPQLMAELTVAETMFVGQLPATGLFRRVDWRGLRERARAALEALGLDIDERGLARHLSIAQQQQVECAKALLHGARVILFDEPTSPLTTREVDRLFTIMRRLTQEGCTLGFISHRMNEVEEISDRISVLRDGALVDGCGRDEFDRVRLMSSMVGRTISVIPRRTSTSSTATPVLEVDRLAHADIFADVSFTLHQGEILGLAGLVGAGRTEIAETIFGVRAPRAGQVRLAGRDITGRSPPEVMRAGLAYVPEDRAKHGAILPMTIAENVSAASLDRIRRAFGLISRRHEDSRAGAEIERLRVRCAGTGQPLRELSGGNQQKVVFAKWIGVEPLVAILDEPTRGVDVGAKEEIYALIERLAHEGIAILVISSEMEELVRLSDRVISIYEGRVVAVIEAGRITPERVGRSYLSADGLGLEETAA